MSVKCSKVLVLISGSGTNLQALIDAQLNDNLPIEICAVISNRPDVKGLERAEKAHIATQVVDHKEFSSRLEFDTAMMKTIDQYQPDLVVLAGFMRILTPEFVQHYLGKMLNIHPSLLPKYPGLHTHQRAIDAGDSEHGVTVHFVTEELDGGPAIIQAKIAVLKDDDADSLAKRVQQQEHRIYPLAVQWFAEKRIKLVNNSCHLDGELLPECGYLIDQTQE
ncbi:phosphoribosylglycinamide formyltransferase [Aurantivibrio infirmus]